MHEHCTGAERNAKQIPSNIFNISMSMNLNNAMPSLFGPLNWLKNTVRYSNGIEKSLFMRSASLDRSHGAKNSQVASMH